MLSIDEFLTQPVCQTLHSFILRTKGQETFFLGKLGRDGKVDKVKAISRGGPRSLMILMTLPQYGDVVLRNCPEILFETSMEDLDLKSRFEEKGIGYFLINNHVQEIDVLLEPFRDDEQAQPLDEEEMTALLGPDGPLAKHLDGYEQRNEQVAMLRDVVRGLNHDQILSIEAGTGTGKSLAYLLPSIHWALKNKERVLISTNTINLQEQLFNKDIPFLQKVFDQPFQAVLVKGRNNYLCLRKLQQQSASPQLLDNPSDHNSLRQLVRWAERTSTGDRSDLPYMPKSLLWSSLAADTESCQRMKCESYRSCFYYIARRQQAEANVLITNHHILFADLAVREATENYHAPALLPPYQRVILDEAHNIEDSASSFLGFQVTRGGVTRALSMLLKTNRRKEEVGLLHQFAILLLDNSSFIQEATKLRREIFEELIPEVRNQKRSADQMSVKAHQILIDPEQNHPMIVKVRITRSLIEQGPWPDLQELGLSWASGLQKLTNQLVRLAGILEEASMAVEKSFKSPLMDFSAAITRLGNAAHSLQQFFTLESEEPDTNDESSRKNKRKSEEEKEKENEEDKERLLVRWFELKSKDPSSLKLQTAPLELGKDLERMLYDRFGTVVLTSATLSTGRKNFHYFFDRLGINRVPNTRIATAVYPSPFAYKEQTLIGIPNDIPNPNEATFEEAIARIIYSALEHSGGRAFVLFTSFRLLQAVHDRVAPKLLKNLGIRSISQGDGQRHILLQKKISDPTSVLFGTDSFWEGVDVRGEALCNVIITRLPFRVPSEPLIEARMEAIEERGGNSFAEYTIPSATIKFKQGFGRLIRSQSDWGTVLILDKRVVEKSYGKRFLQSLPEACPKKIGSTESVLAALKQFHQNRTLHHE